MSYYVQGPRGEWVPIADFRKQHSLGDPSYSLLSGSPRTLGQLGEGQNLTFIGSQLRQIKDKLLQVDAIMRRSPDAAKAVGRDTAKAWEQYTFLVSNYQRFRVLFGLEPEPGLAGDRPGLGQVLVGGITLAVLGAAVAALLVTVGILLQRALEAEKTKEALSTALATQTGAPSGTRLTPVTTSSGQTIFVSEQPGILDWILANPGTSILIGGLGGLLLLELLRG